MNRYHLVHVTEFCYDGPVSESYNELRLRPMDDERQSCVSFRLAILPSGRAVSYKDAFGNWAHQFNVLREHRQLKVEADSSVLVHDFPAPPPNPMTFAEFDSMQEEVFEEHFDFVSPTAYVPRLSALSRFVETAESRSRGTVQGFAQAACGVINEEFRYGKGATHVHSSIEDALSKGMGVCQDFAHLLLGILRTRGLPARYVSGYLVPGTSAEGNSTVEQVIGGQASHAWAEVYLPNTGWMALDPTLGKPVGLRHVRLAYGRDYGDVAPVRGVYKGHAGQRLSVDVSVRPAVDSDGHEQLNETAAAPVDPPVMERAHQPQQQ